MDIKDILSRLKKIPDKSGFAKSAGISRATMYRLVGDKPNPDLKTLKAAEKQLLKIERSKV